MNSCHRILSISWSPALVVDQGFRPFKDGPSIVVELKVTENGQSKWKAFLAEQMPPVLEDEIKRLRLTMVKEL